MDIRQLNKALTTLSEDSIDIGESRFVCGGERMARDAKRSSKRARRRARQVLTAMELAEYECSSTAACEAEVARDENEHKAVEEMVDFLLGEMTPEQVDEDVRAQCSWNRLRLLCVPSDACFILDGNCHGIIFWVPAERRQEALTAFRDNGCCPFVIPRAQAEGWVTEIDSSLSVGEPWNLREWNGAS